jgi:hypothetical protein
MQRGSCTHTKVNFNTLEASHQAGTLGHGSNCSAAAAAVAVNQTGVQSLPAELCGSYSHVAYAQATTLLELSAESSCSTTAAFRSAVPIALLLCAQINLCRSVLVCAAVAWCNTAVHTLHTAQ